MRFKRRSRSRTASATLVCAHLAASIVLIGGVVHAENLGRGRGVMERARPDYDVSGIRLHSFRLFPATELRFGYDDNVLASDSGTKDDARFKLSPSLRLESDWTRHAFSITADSSSDFHASSGDESYTDWGVGGKSRLDLLESMNVESSIGFRTRTEPRESIDSFQVLDEPTEYDQLDVSSALNHTFNRVSTSLGGGFTRLSYDDSPRVGGGVVDQGFRDRDVLSGIARVGYAFAAGHSAFVQGTISDRDYRVVPATAAFKRDSLGYEIVAGWFSEISNLISGEIYAGYIDRDYDGSGLSDVSDFTVGLDLEWYVTELTTLKAGVSRGVPDSTTAGVGGILRSAVSLGVDYELLPNLLVDWEVSYEKNDFQGSARDDDWVRAGVGVRYLLSRHVHLDVAYDFDNRASNLANLDFQRNRVSMGVRFQH